jgi:hypothetical protein
MMASSISLTETVTTAPDDMQPVADVERNLGIEDESNPETASSQTKVTEDSPRQLTMRLVMP